LLSARPQRTSFQLLAQHSSVICAIDNTLSRLAALQALAERQAIEDFLSAGDALLALQASSVEEIGRAGQEARCLVARLAEVPQVRLADALHSMRLINNS
jgi:hypothetical protein